MPTLPSDILITLLSNALLVVPLAIAVVLICRFVKRPAVAWCLWALVLLKFVTPAWYPLPVEDMTTLLTAAAPDEPSASIPLSDVMLTNLPLPVAEPEPEVRTEPSLLEQLAASQLREALTAPPPMTPEFSLPDEGMSTKPIIVETVESDEDVTIVETELASDDITSLSGGMASRRQPGRHVVTAPNQHDHPPDGVRAWHPSWADLWTELPKTQLLATFWAAGSVVLIGVTLLRVLRFGRLVQRAEQASPAIVARVHDLAARLGCRRVPDVRVTSARVPPLLWAVGRRPVILLPSALLDQLDEEQTAALLTHELAHYVRRDHWTRWFEQGVCCLYWWHPVAWWAGHRLREAEEQCCDARVVSLTPDAARPYANALLTTIEFLNPPDHSVPALASGITPVRRSLRPFHRRLTMILEDRPSPTLTWTSRLSLLAVAVIVLPLSLVAIGDDEAPATPATSVESPDEISGFEIRESETSDSEILKSEISNPTESTPREEITTEDDDQPSSDESTGDTITVVRAFYPMPEELAKAFQTFIAYQTHFFEILSATADWRVIEESDDSEGNSLPGGVLGGGFGRGVRRGRPMQSGLTLIANEDVQQHFGDFIHAVTDAASTQSENGKDTERITLVRESYDVARMDVTTHSEDFDSKKIGNILDDLLQAVKATNQVQWLLLKSHGGQLTVTTTSEFQEALDKFIAFLKERAPTDREQEVSDLNDVQRKIKAKILLENARHKLECNDFLGARLLAEQAEALHAKYELFEDRPELVLNDLRLKEQAPDLSAGSIRQGPSSGNGIGGVGGIGGGVFRGDGLFPGASGGNLFERSTGSPQLPSVRHDAMLTPDQQLASLRMQEQMIGAEIASIERAMEAGASRAALSLMIGRKYADNAVTQKLVETLAAMLALQQEKAELMSSRSEKHPDVVLVTQKLEALRQSLGLPKEDNGQPIDLVTLHLESLRLQQQMLKNSIESILPKDGGTPYSTDEASSNSGGRDNQSSTDATEMTSQLYRRLSELVDRTSQLEQSLGSNEPSITYLHQGLKKLRLGMIEMDEQLAVRKGTMYMIRDELQKYSDLIKAMQKQIEVEARQAEVSSNETQLERLDRDIRDLEARRNPRVSFYRALKDGLKAGGELEAVRRAMALLKSDEYRQRGLEAGWTAEDLEANISWLHSLFELIEKYELLLRDQDAEKSEIRNLDQQIRRDLKFFWAGKPVEIEQGFVRSLYEERLDGDFWIEKELCLEEELESLNSQRRELKQNDDDPNEEATVTE